MCAFFLNNYFQPAWTVLLKGTNRPTKGVISYITRRIATIKCNWLGLKSNLLRPAQFRLDSIRPKNSKKTKFQNKFSFICYVNSFYKPVQKYFHPLRCRLQEFVTVRVQSNLLLLGLVFMTRCQDNWLVQVRRTPAIKGASRQGRPTPKLRNGAEQSLWFRLDPQQRDHSQKNNFSLPYEITTTTVMRGSLSRI